MTHLEAVRDAVVMEPGARLGPSQSEDATVLAQSGVQHRALEPGRRAAVSLAPRALGQV